MPTKEEAEAAVRLTMARTLDMPIQCISEAQEALVYGDIEKASEKLGMAMVIIGKVIGLDEAYDDPKPTPQNRGYAGGEDAVEYTKGLAAGIWKGIFGEDPRQAR